MSSTRSARPNVVVTVDGYVPRSGGVDEGVVDYALVGSGRNSPEGVYTTDVRPRPHVRKTHRSVDHPVSIAVYALSVLFKADAGDRTHGSVDRGHARSNTVRRNEDASVPVRYPDVAVLVDGSPGRVMSAGVVGIGGILSEHDSGKGVDLDDSTLVDTATQMKLNAEVVLLS